MLFSKFELNFKVWAWSILKSKLLLINLFENLLTACISCFKIKFTDYHLKRTNTKSVFPGYVEMKQSERVEPDFSEFKLEELTWMSVGEFIINFYKAFEANGWGKHTILTLNDFISTNSTSGDKKSDMETEPPAMIVGNDVPNDTEGSHLSPPPALTMSDDEKDNSNSNEGAKCVSTLDQQVLLSADGSADDSDATKQNDVPDKPKQSRRRGSDLKFLEQWGWHKTKKPPVPRRKNVEQNECETSINGIIKRILAKHFE